MLTKINLFLLTALLSATSFVYAALPADVDTAVSAAQSDILAMITKGFAYLGAIVGLMTVLTVFVKIISKGKRG